MSDVSVQRALHAEVCLMLRSSAVASELETGAWRALLDIAERHDPFDRKYAVVCGQCLDEYGEMFPTWPCADFRACARAVGVEIPQ